MKLSDEYERHCHDGVMNKAHEGVPEHPQQVIRWFLMQIPPQADSLILCCEVRGYCNGLAPGC